MSTAAKSLYVAIGLAALAPALGFTASGLFPWTLLPVAIGLAWWLGRSRGWRWIASPAMVCLVILDAFGMLRAVFPAWMLAGAAAALAAWDLDHFSQRLASAARVERERQWVSAHLRRLGVVAGLGSLLGLIGLSLQIQLGLGWAIALGLLAVVSLAQAVRSV